jgi:isochorismate synthase EntC
MDEVDYEAITQKISEVTLQNKQLRRANLNKDKTIKHLRRIIKKMKDDAAKDRKPHFRKGQKRGSRGFSG